MYCIPESLQDAKTDRLHRQCCVKTLEDLSVEIEKTQFSYLDRLDIKLLEEIAEQQQKIIMRLEMNFKSFFDEVTRLIYINKQIFKYIYRILQQIKKIKLIIQAVKDVRPEIILENSEIFMQEGNLNTLISEIEHQVPKTINNQQQKLKEFIMQIEKNLNNSMGQININFLSQNSKNFQNMEQQQENKIEEKNIQIQKQLRQNEYEESEQQEIERLSQQRQNEEIEWQIQKQQREMKEMQQQIKLNEQKEREQQEIERLRQQRQKEEIEWERQKQERQLEEKEWKQKEREQQEQIEKYLRQIYEIELEIQKKVKMQEQEQQRLNYKKQLDPKCSEHLIKDLIYDLDGSINPKLDDLNKLKKMINDDEKIDSKKIDKSFDSLNTRLKNNEIKKMKIILQDILEQTRPLDIEELNVLINKAEKAANKLHRKDVILLMGQTGAGKSTTVYFLAGQKLEIKKIYVGENLFVDNYAPQGQIINEDLQQINISSKGKSETRYITPIEIEFEGKKTIICDSPGFGDTAGAEVDIANGIGIIEAIKHCKSVRPVIVVSYGMVGDRGEGLKKLTQLIVQMFKGNIKDQLDSFTYLYTKFSNEIDITSFLQNIYNSIKDEEDDESSFKFIFEDMIKKSKQNKKDKQIEKINPSQGKDRDSIPNNIWEKNPIINPDDVFQYIITENSRQKLQEQTTRHNNCIQFALQNFEFDLLDYKMNHLKLLKDKLKLQELENIYNQKVQQIKRFVTQQYEIKIDELNKIVENQNDLQKNDIQKYQNFINKLRPALILRQNHVSDIPCADELIQNIVQQGNKLQKKLKQIDVYDKKFVTDFNNLQLLNQEFSEQIKDKYENTLEQFDGYFKSSYQQSVTHINQKEFKEVADILNSIQQFIKIFDKKIDLSLKSQVYHGIIKYINDQINKSNQQCASIVQKESFDEKELKQLIEYEQLFQNLSETFQIHDHIPKETIQNAFDQFYNYFLSYFKGISTQINAVFDTDRDEKSENCDLFLSIKSQFEKMICLRKQITGLKNRSSEIYDDSLKIIVNEVRQQQLDQIKKLKKDPQNFDPVQFSNFLIKLKNSQWIDQYKAGVYAESMEQIKNLITEQLQIWKNEMDELPLDIKNGENIQKAYKIKEYSEKFQQFQDQFTGLDTIIFSISDKFQKALEKNLKLIQDQFNQENLFNIYDAETADQAIVFLNHCNNQVKLKQEIQQTENILHGFLKTYPETSLKQMQNILDDLFNAENEGQIKKSSENAQCLQYKLKNLKAIQEFKNISEFIKPQEIIQQMKAKLIQIWNEFNLISQQTDITNIKENLIKTKILFDLDQFIDDQNIKFYSLYQNFMTKNELKENQKQLFQQIDKSQFEQFANQLKITQHIDDEFKNKIKQILSMQINSLFEKFKQQTKMMNQQNFEIDEICTIMQHLNNAKKFIPKDYLEDQTSQILITNHNQYIAEISEKINQKINQISDYLNDNRFKEAEQIRKHLIQLQAFILAEDQICKLIDGLEKKIDDMIVFKCEQQSKVMIKEYRYYSPKYFFEKLHEICVLKKKSLYDQEYNKLQNKIRQDIEKQIDSIKNRNVYERQIEIKQLEQALKFLPSILKKDFDIKISDEINQIQEDFKNLNKELEDLKNSDDYKKQYSFIKKCEDNKYSDKKIQMEKFIDRKVAQIFLNIQSSIQNQNYQNALEIYLNLINYHITFEDSKHIEKVNKSKDILQQKFESFITELQSIHSRSSQQSTIEKSYEYYQQFIKFNNNIKIIDPKLTFQSENEQKLKQGLVGYFKNLYRSYEGSLQNFDIQRLEESLQEIKKWQNLMQNISISSNMLELNKIIISLKRDNNQISKQITQQLDYSLQEINKENFKSNLSEKELEKHYQKFQIKIEFNRQVSRIRENIKSDYNLYIFEQLIIPKLEKKIYELIGYTLDIINSNDKDINFQQFRINIKNLIVYEKISKLKVIGIGIEEIKQLIFVSVRNYTQVCYDAKKDFNILTQNLIKIQVFIDEIPTFSKEITIKMQQILKRIKQDYNPQEFYQIYLMLDQDNGAGKSIIQEHEQYFKGFQIYLFNSNTAIQNIEYVKRYIEGDSIDSYQLSIFYQRYKDKYQVLIEKYIVNSNTQQVIMELVNKVKSIPSKKINHKDIYWNVNDEILDIMAYIFTIQTISNIQYYDEMKDVEQKQREEYLWQPHPGQIIAIFRILGIGYQYGFFKTLFGLNEQRLVNNFIQIGTGEGKSVTLAVTACILGLYDIDVYCASYSEYLSQKDYKNFSNLFEKLGLIERIHYGTFNKLCKDVIEDKFNIRQKVKDIVQSGVSERQIKKDTRHKILLIDEVDVFFSDDFYGKIYVPLAIIKHDKIKNLTDFLWQNREKKFSMKQIENTQEFKNLYKQFKGWEQLIKEIVKNMKQDLLCFKHDYVVQNQKIGYREQDHIVFNAVYGYKTMWAHYDEFYKDNITQKVLEDNISIQITCGSFSFAEIPKCFLNILGVSGTLKTMSDAQKKIISDDYKIKIFTYMPSIFGMNQCEFNEQASVRFWNKDDYFKEIRVEIKKNIGEKPNQRACLVFFETIQKLKNFYQYYSREEQSVQYITEETSPEEQQNIIKKSTIAGSVTLLTKLFGRGINFIVRDQNISSNRGIHVLQTFLSEEVSEETQIKGRTARQGQKGTFSMVLLNEDLEKYLGPKYLKELKDMKEKKNLYGRLNVKRNQYFDNKQKSISEMIQNIKTEHYEAVNFKQSLLDKKIEKIQNFLIQQNRGETGQIESRTICLMDATGSMSRLLQKTKNTVGQMFDRAHKVLEDNDLRQDCFQLQFLVYRDYDSKKDEILQYSTWESKPKQLSRFMETICAKGGGDYEEAIEIGLLHCNRENEINRINQIILIGDAPAKEQSAIDKDRQANGGEYYWIRNGFPNTHYRKEVQKLKEKNIPIHSFYLHPGAKSNFEEISKLTNGKCGLLEIDKDSGSEQLIALVTETILQNLSKGNELVDQYRKKFGKAFA